MDHTTFLVTVFCLIDDWLRGQGRVRQRGPQPVLADSEVLTMEVLGEWLGLDTDKAIYQHFGRYYREWFPRLRQVDRVTFVRQAANLWRVKERLWQHLLTQLDYDPALSVVDSFPLPVCRFGRAYRCRRLREWSAWGYDDVAQQRFFGMRVHVRICWPGVIVGLALFPADVHDRWAAEDLLPQAHGWVLGDTNYWSPLLRNDLAAQGACLLAPRKTSVKRDHHPWPHWLTQTRRRIETVIGQLVGRFHGKRVWARDPWHLCSRWLRKLLSHTFAFFLAQHAGLDSPLQFAGLLSD